MNSVKIFIIAVGVVASALALKSAFRGPSKSSTTSAQQVEYRFKCAADDHVFTLTLKDIVSQMESGETDIDANNQRRFTCPQCGDVQAVEYPERMNDDGTIATD